MVEKRDVMEFLEYDVMQKEEVAPEVKDWLRRAMSECNRFDSPYVFAKCIKDKWFREEGELIDLIDKRIEREREPFNREAYDVLRAIPQFSGIELKDVSTRNIECEESYLYDCEEDQCSVLLKGKRYCVSGEVAKRLHDIEARWDSKLGRIPLIKPDINSRINKFLAWITGCECK